MLLALALFYADSVSTLFRLFPVPVLGVILFFGGVELASSTDSDGHRTDRVVLVVTAGLSLWNPGVAYLAGLLLYHRHDAGSSGSAIQTDALPPIARSLAASG